jgi:hypothetical protein
MEILELSKRGGRAGSAAGEWTCDVDGGVTLNPGDTVQVLRSYVHIPGSSEVQTGIVVTQQLRATVTFCYGATYLTENDLSSFKDFYHDRSGSGTINPGDELYFRNKVGGGLVKDTFELVLEPGTFTGPEVAEELTKQMRAFNPTKRFDEQNTANIGDVGRATGRSTNTYRSFFVTNGEEDLYNDGTAGTGAVKADRCFTPKSAQHFYYQGCSQAAVEWDSSGQKFRLRLHALPNDNNGEPGIIRGKLGGGALREVLRHQFIGITDFGFTAANWEGSLWDVLGFTYDDLGAVAAASETGYKTQNEATSAIFAANGGSNMGRWANATGQGAVMDFILVNETTDVNSAPLASNSPSLGETSGGYWRIETSLLTNKWRIGDGSTAPQALATADRSYASGDLYVGQPGPPVQFRAAAPMSFTSVQCRIVDPATGEIETDAGEESTLVLAITRASAADSN